MMIMLLPLVVLVGRFTFMVRLTGVRKLMHSIDSDKQDCETSLNLTQSTASLPKLSKFSPCMLQHSVFKRRSLSLIPCYTVIVLQYSLVLKQHYLIKQGTSCVIEALFFYITSFSPSWYSTRGRFDCEVFTLILSVWMIHYEMKWK